MHTKAVKKIFFFQKTFIIQFLIKQINIKYECFFYKPLVCLLIEKIRCLIYISKNKDNVKCLKFNSVI